MSVTVLLPPTPRVRGLPFGGTKESLTASDQPLDSFSAPVAAVSEKRHWLIVVGESLACGLDHRLQLGVIVHPARDLTRDHEVVVADCDRAL